LILIHFGRPLSTVKIEESGELFTSTTTTTITTTAEEREREKEKSKKMTEQRTEIRQIHVPRAAKACLACRRQKTRCFPSNDSSSCLRCLSLARPCSFSKDGDGDGNKNNGGGATVGGTIGGTTITMGTSVDSAGQISQNVSNNGGTNGTRKRQRTNANTEIDYNVNVTELDKNVKRILSLLQTNQSRPISHPATSNSTEPDDIPLVTTKAPFKTSPFALISNSVSSKSTPSSIRQLFQSQIASFPHSINILSLNIINFDEAVSLIDKFKECYSRWISLPMNITTHELILSMKSSCPLLLTTICATSLRYQKHNTHDKILYENLLKQLKIELFQEISSPGHSLEFLKALVIISVYGYSLSSEGLILDPWFISGTAVQKFLTLDVESELLNLDKLHESLDLEKEVEKLSNYRIWNHICLVHLVNCVFSSRMCVLDEIRLDQSRKSLDLSQATNFDGRIVSEISLQLLLYNYLQSSAHYQNTLDFENFEQDLQIWYEQWSYLFRQPTLQFVEFGYHYVYIVALYHHHFNGKNIINHKNDEEITDKELLEKFMQHCIKLIDHINNIKDIVYFLCLSDQIHLCTVYTTLLFIKLIKWSQKYGELSAFDISDLIFKVQLIKEKFNKVSQETNDLAYTFASGIQESIDSILTDI